MERRLAAISVSSIAISEAKAGYIITKGVLVADVNEVFENAPRFFLEVNAEGDSRYFFLGPNLNGRFLLVAIAPVESSEEENEWRLISAYWLRERRGRRLYEGG